MAVVESMLLSLNRAEIRYVVVGGLAVVLHGHARFTDDLDLAVDLEEEAARRTIDICLDLGLEPRLDVDPLGFADPQIRRAWRDDGHGTLPMVDPHTRMRAVDLLLDEPIPFEELWNRSESVELERTTIRVAGLDDLIRIKEATDRGVDREDVRALRQIVADREARQR